MKRTSLTTAVIAGIAGVAGISNMASAVYLNNDGLGQVLIYPYYTVNGGNSTAITVVNTTGTAKAVKVRFLEAYDSREVLDFNLYLSHFDYWTAQVVPVGGGAGVFSNDNSCTVPALPKTSGSAYPFSTAAFDGSVTANDGGPKTVSRTLEGYVELIEMGTLLNTTQSSAAAATHSGGVPANCGQLVKAWAGGYWASAAATDIGPTTGGLFGSGTIVNVNLGTIEGYNADAIDQFYNDILPHHTTPTSLSPSISSNTSRTSYVFASTPTSTVAQLATTTYAVPAPSVDAISSLFMADNIYNEYWTSGGTGANSEWVITFPTKRFYVDPTLVPVARAPFDVRFTAANGGTSCSPIFINWYDREEGTASGSIGFSPQPVFGNALCYEAQVVTFNQTGASSVVLGSKLTANISTGFNNGWAQIDLFGASPAQHVLATASSANVFNGLPVTGFWVTQLVNGNIGGVLSNYTALYRHKLHRLCSTAAGTAACS
ncbi:MAG: hypothetical protein E6K53_07085 [Gammaproteobacteria bacterium]|nr:MAG: hypothetical protein E6K53_07085 [Gammaproteobacteria bacterium]